MKDIEKVREKILGFCSVSPVPPEAGRQGEVARRAGGVKKPKGDLSASGGFRGIKNIPLDTF